MIVYIDESGDLGWTLDKPYGMGGSSRYLTIALLIIPNDKNFLSKKIVRNFYKQYRISPKKEIKGTELSLEQKQYLVGKIIDLLKNNPEIKIITITTQKTNVQDHIRADSNKLYNYMIRLALLDEIINEDSVTLIPDPRSIKVESGNSLLDYLQIELWFEYNSSTNLDQKVVSSENSLNLKFVDIISNLIWRKFEKATTEADLLIPHIKVKKLFFNS